MQITADGNVGIGNTSPSAKLNVESTSSTTPIAEFYYNDNATDATRPRLDIWGSKNKINLRTTYNQGGADLSFGTENVHDALVIMNNGNVGIGTASPSTNTKLHISNCPTCDFTKTQPALFKVHQSSNTDWAAEIYNNGSGGKGLLIIADGTTTGVPALKTQNIAGDIGLIVNSNGTVGIGTTPDATYKLSVNGAIRAKSLKVEPTWADFVFKKNYNLMPLEEVDEYIKQNGHLPEIPNAEEVAKNGIDVGEINAKLLQKIEELTLYMIQMKKENENLKRDIDKIRKINNH